MKKKFSKLILSLNAQPMEVQKQIFEDTMIDWIGDEEQTDDILLIGIKV